MKCVFFIFLSLLTIGCISSKKPEFDLLPLDVTKLAPQESLNIHNQVQPNDFDPSKNVWKKYPLGNSSPSQLYCETPDCDAPQMNINGWETEGDRKIILPKPFDLNFYEFAAASSSDYILELRKHGKRQGLYRDIIQFGYITKPNGGKLAMQHRNLSIKILDLSSGSELELPRSRCTENLGHFSEQVLITHSDKNSIVDYDSADNYETEFCIWNLAGKLEARLSGKIDWIAASVYALSDFGITPSSSLTFFALNSFGTTDGSCFLILQDTKNPSRSARFAIPEKLNRGEYEFCHIWDLNLAVWDFTEMSHSSD